MMVRSAPDDVEMARNVAESFGLTPPSPEQIRDVGGHRASPEQLSRLYDLFADIEDLVTDPDHRPKRGSEFREIGGAVGCDHPDPVEWAAVDGELVALSIDVMELVRGFVAAVTDPNLDTEILIERRWLAIATACEAIGRGHGDLVEARDMLLSPGDAGVTVAELVTAGRRGSARKAIRVRRRIPAVDRPGRADNKAVVALSSLGGVIDRARRFVGRDGRRSVAEHTWHGTVTRVHDESFDADLFEPATGDSRDVTIPIALMPEEVRPVGRLWPGRTFVLHTYRGRESERGLEVDHRSLYVFDPVSEPAPVDTEAEARYVEAHLRLKGR